MACNCGKAPIKLSNSSPSPIEFCHTILQDYAAAMTQQNLLRDIPPQQIESRDAKVT